MLAATSKDYRIMKFVNETSTTVMVRRDTLKKGTLFRYPNDPASIYMKTNQGHVALNTGSHFSGIADGEVIVIDGTLTYKDQV
jgi:hypothetical protein